MLFTGTENLEIELHGSIYNAPSTASAHQFIYDCYVEHGIEFARYLDGEFSVVILDRIERQVIIACDPFKLKSMFVLVTPQQTMRVTTGAAYKELKLKQTLCSGTVLTPVENTTSVYCLVTREHLQTIKNKHFTGVGYKRDFDDFIAAFEIAVYKRCTGFAQGKYVSMSSGYDSGCIFLAMRNQGQACTVYSDMRDPGSEKIVKERAAMHLNSKLVAIDNSPDMLSKAKDFLTSHIDVSGYLCEIAGVPNHEHLLTSHGGEINHTLIELRAMADRNFIHLNGLGADGLMVAESMGNSGGIPPVRSAEYIYIDYISSQMGIDVRFPFLDPKVVQEYLLLADDVKKSAYKAPLKYYMEQNRFPFEENVKYGFGLKDWQKDVKLLYGKH